jgi:hypothetical protein
MTDLTLSPDRIRCVNLKCRRTFAADKFEPETEIICGKCLKALPDSLRLRQKQIWRRHAKMKRLAKRLRESRAEQLNRAYEIHMRIFWLSWYNIKAYFNAPERPEGLGRFLEEVGL